MKWLSKRQRSEIRKLAAACPDQEVCGFVFEGGEVLQAPNVAADPSEQFEISPLFYAKHEGNGIKGIWHTHLHLDGFSPLDQQVMAADTLPWAVYCLENDNFSECDPSSACATCWPAIRFWGLRLLLIGQRQAHCHGGGATCLAAWHVRRMG